MFSNKENVNILTSLLVAHGIHHAVVCPGSRNAPIVHNLNECPSMQCYPVTDERSAGFYALGMCQALTEPVVVCVTSGTALLNLMPAVAEAFYQHLPLVVVSADRPPQWIDQLDGQTLPQPDALGRFVRKAVSLPEPSDAEGHWYSNRLINEALIACQRQGKGPVHINVPISEPFFGFNVETLPEERYIHFESAEMLASVVDDIGQRFLNAKRPMLVSGQPMNPNLDEAIYLVEDDERYLPDFVLYTGGSIVSKRVKHYLRKVKEVWAVNESGEVNDTFMNMTALYQGKVQAVVEHINHLLASHPHPFIQRWKQLLAEVAQKAQTYSPAYSQMAVVKYFEAHVGEGIVHYANSQAIRVANIYARHNVYCNRGVNGIEGSLSTAAGFSCVTDERVYCVIGDLSFFYDENALWNQNLRGNLRILMLNNGRGGIFNLLHGLEKSPARDTYVAASHHTSAEGICRQNDVVYMKAENEVEMQSGIDTLLNINSERPVVLEVITDVVEDERVYKSYYKGLKQ